MAQVGPKVSSYQGAALHPSRELGELSHCHNFGATYPKVVTMIISDDVSDETRIDYP